MVLVFAHNGVLQKNISIAHLQKNDRFAVIYRLTSNLIGHVNIRINSGASTCQCVSIWRYEDIQMYEYIQIRTSLCVCRYISMYAYAYMYIKYICTYTYICTHIYVNIYVYIHVYVHIHVCILINIYIHVNFGKTDSQISEDRIIILVIRQNCAPCTCSYK